MPRDVITDHRVLRLRRAWERSGEPHAMPLVEKYASSGNPEAQLPLDQMLTSSEGSDSADRAIRWLKAGVDQGHAEACMKSAKPRQSGRYI